MVNVVFLLEIFGIATIFLAMLLLLDGDGAREQKLMQYFLCGSLIQNIGYVLELTAPVKEVAVAAIKVEYMGCTFIPLCYCLFLYSYCYEKPPKGFLKILGLIDFATLFFVFTCDRHTLFYRSMEWLETEKGHGYLWLDYGALYPVFLASWMVIPYILSLYVLIRAILIRRDNTENRQYKTIFLVSLLPITAFILYAVKLIRVFDPTPLVLGLGLSLVAILIWSRRNYDFRRLAADMVLESMADGVITLDEQRRLVSYNQAAAEMFPGLRNHRLGEHINNLTGFQERMLDEEASRTFEFGDRYYESHARQITAGNSKCQGYVILILDVTETRNYINEIKQVRRQAEQASMAKSEFLANMSHEIRTPMNAIIGLSDIIIEESRGRKVYAYAQDVQSAAKNLLAIINDILDLSKVEAGKLELALSEYYIKTVVNGVVGMMDMAASQRGLLMKCEFDMGIPCKYLGDEGRIKQILINLLNNAVKFTKEGHVKISISGMPGASEQEELLVFRVEDTGCGIRKEDQEKIFEDFKQVDAKRNRSVEGTGLGLSITKHLVQLMGGKIGVESNYGRGSVFTVTIPQHIVDSRTLKEVPEEPMRESEQMDEFIAPDVKILIVDDNKVNRKVAMGFLNAYAFDLTEASSGSKAIGLVKQTKFDIIFMDHMMPEMDGIETVEHIRRDCGENGTGPIIVALTANAMQGVREKFLNCGFQDFIPKPLERRPLHDLLKRWIPEERRQEKTGKPSWQQRTDSLAAFQIKGIQADKAAQYGCNSAEEYKELLELFCLDVKRKTVLLKELYGKQEIKNYEVEVHGLKSASANIGAMELSALAKEAEAAAHSGDLAGITQGFPLLLETYGKLLEEIENFLQKWFLQKGKGMSEVSGKEEALPAVDRETLIRETKEALEKLEKFRSRECAEKIETLLRRSPEEAIAAKLRKIQEQLKMYEDDIAESLLHQLIEELEIYN